MIPACLLAAVLPLFAQQAPPPQEELPAFRAETALALVRFHVVRKSLYVDDLKPEDIQLLEDGVPRKITLFEGGRTARRTVPVELILVFDISGSVTQEGLLDPLVFKTTLLDGMENVRLSVYGFDSSLKRFSRATREAAQLASAFNRVLNYRTGSTPRPEVIRLQLPPKRKADSRGGTWIFESVIAAARDAASAGGNATRMLLVFSDGFATTTTRPDDAASVLGEMGIPVYPMVLGHARLNERARQAQAGGYNRQGVLSEGARARLQRIQEQETEILEYARLGEMTGGRSFDPPLVNLDIMRRMLGVMVGQIRCEYVVGFSPEPRSGQPARRKLEVKLRGKELGKVLGGTRTVTH